MEDALPLIDLTLRPTQDTALPVVIPVEVEVEVGAQDGGVKETVPQATDTVVEADVRLPHIIAAPEEHLGHQATIHATVGILQGRAPMEVVVPHLHLLAMVRIVVFVQGACLLHQSVLLLPSIGPRHPSPSVDVV